jgi:hypothetical protein
MRVLSRARTNASGAPTFVHLLGQRGALPGGNFELLADLRAKQQAENGGIICRY